jgi:hypothetical protein
MKKDRLSFLIIIAISFLFPLSCAYAHYNDIMEADFLTHGTKYEAADIENLVVDKYKLTAVTPPLVSTLLYLKENFPGTYLDLPLSTLSNHLASSVLRC